MSRNGVIRTSCRICGTGCGMLVHVKDGKAVRIEGDPDSLTRGVACPKGLASLEYLYHPDRLNYPLKRVGGKGEGKWQRITWDEALDAIADQIIEARDNYGAESIVLVNGTARGFADSYIARFANVLGTPNYSNPAQVCYVPGLLASRITYGFIARQDLSYSPALVVNWAINTPETYPRVYAGIIQAMSKDTKFIVVDPRETDLAARADIWLQLRPGSDLALALAMINVIISEGLYDKDFVENWTVGFDELRLHVQDYPPDKVEEITWIDAQKITDAARAYARNKPACIMLGNPVESGINNFQSGRAICILRAITGNLEIPGGELRPLPLPIVVRRAPEMVLSDKISKEQFKKRLDANLNLLPIPPVSNQAMWQSIIGGIIGEGPYPVRVLYVQAGNPLVTYPNSRRVYEGLRKLNFLVVADLFMTPTAALADIVLPIVHYLECDDIWTSEDFAEAQVQQKVVERVAECRTEHEVWSGLAKRIDLGHYFEGSEEEILDFILKSAGLTFEEFRKVGAISTSTSYRNYEKDGFPTPSGKVELYSSRLKEWGFDPLPRYYEPPETPYSDHELAREYPLVFATRKLEFYRHSAQRQITSLRGIRPEPLIEINPETARKLGISDGDWVYVETRRGRIKQKARLSSGIDPRVVFVDYGWWFPEKEGSSLFGWEESNSNVLTDDKPPYSPEMGSPNFRGMLCKVYKVW